MYRPPNRPRHDITQDFNDGVVNICAVTDGAAVGEFPKEVLSPKITLRFCELRLGINRAYLARQNQTEILRVIRVQKAGGISPLDVAVIDGVQYGIDTIQKADVYPPSVDLALTKIEQR